MTTMTATPTTGLAPEVATREGRMLAAGSLTVTVKSLATGQHVTLRMRASAKDEEGPRRWPTVPFVEATHVFIDSFDGERVATFYPQNGEMRFAENANAAARWTVQAVLRYVAGVFPALTDQAEVSAADLCGHCGRQLTDPESIDRGIGPDCYGKLTGSKHAALWE